MVLHAAAVGDGSTTLELTILDRAGTIIQAYGNDVASSTTVTGTFNFIVPEPSTMLLISAALCALTLLPRRRRD
jgi:hypothetical protein